MQTQKTKFTTGWLLMLLAAGMVMTLRPYQPVAADPLAMVGGHCYQVFLPLIMGGTGDTVASTTSVDGGIIIPPGGCAPQSAAVFPDFNGDGYADLVVGVPREDVTQGLDYEDAGAVHVIYGTANGLEALAAQAAVDDQLWHRAISGLDEIPVAEDDLFGAALAMADFNNDGYDDLAVGVPGSMVNGHDAAGAVQVLYGTAVGLTLANTQTWTQESGGIDDSAAAGDRYGHALAAADFDGDGYADLAVGIPGETVNGIVNAGAINIIFGSSGGLKSTIIYFGFSLTAADFNGDGYDDLAIGVSYETHGSGGSAIPYAGAVNIVFGSATGLDAAAGAPIWHQGLSELGSEPAPEEWFGWSLTAADFNNDGYADLAVGVPGDRVFDIAIGSTHILYGSASGPTGDGDKLVYDPANPELLDDFGFAVTAADFNGDGYADLAVGAYRDDPTDLLIENVGSVFVFHSNTNGVQQTDNQNWYQGHNGVAGAPEVGDGFGARLP